MKAVSSLGSESDKARHPHPRSTDTHSPHDLGLPSLGAPVWKQGRCYVRCHRAVGAVSEIRNSRRVLSPGRPNGVEDNSRLPEASKLLGVTGHLEAENHPAHISAADEVV